MKHFIIITNIVLLFSSLIFSNSGFSQDYIIYTDGKRVKAEIIEVNMSEVVYLPYKQANPELQIIEKDDVKEVIYENGSRLIIEKKNQRSMNGGNYYKSSQKELAYKSALKMEILSPLSNHIGFNYERVVKKNMGLEIKVGIVGIGAETFGEKIDYDYSFTEIDQLGNEVSYTHIIQASREKGFFFKFGPKMMFNNENSLRGWYFKPELVYSHIQSSGRSVYSDFQSPDFSYDFSWSFSGNSAGIIANIGYQAIFMERLSFDVNLGFGYTGQFDKLTMEGETNEYILPRYGRSWDDINPPAMRYSHSQYKGAAITAGIALGVLLK